MEKIKVGIINVSDRASQGIYEDIPGKACQELLSSYLMNPIDFDYAVLPDEEDLLMQEMIRMEEAGACLIVTTGGTGPAPRDITPEATEKICQKLLPGFGELMRRESLKFVPTAILSRQTAGIRNHCLILNLPGKPKAIEQCLSVVFPAIPYCIDLIEGPYLENNPEIISCFRPKS